MYPSTGVENTKAIASVMRDAFFYLYHQQIAVTVINFIGSESAYENKRLVKELDICRVPYVEVKAL